MVQAVTRWVLVAVAAGFAVTARADDKKPADAPPGDVKAELLKLNDVTGDEAQQARVVQLVKNKEAGKKAVAEARKMMEAAKGEKAPFNFTACQIVARAAMALRDYDTAEYFYKHNVEDATKLESGGKMLQAYGGLIDTYTAAKNYAQVVAVCERIL